MKSSRFLLPGTCTLAMLATAIVSTAVQAQDAPYPTQNVTLIVSAAAGGTTDLGGHFFLRDKTHYE